MTLPVTFFHLRVLGTSARKPALSDTFLQGANLLFAIAVNALITIYF